MHEFQAFGWRAEDVPDPQDPATFQRSKLDWSEQAREPQRSILGWYRDVIRLRRDLAGGPLSVEQGRGTLTMTRGPVRVICDFERGSVHVDSLFASKTAERGDTA
jgi:maltooligosyltrehalose trehalohydrolase